MECRRCGTCCVAPDISTLGKGFAERCPHLTEGLLCGIYGSRPPVCRDYAPWELCKRLDAPDLAGRVRQYLDAFGFKPDGTDTGKTRGP